MHAQGFVVGRRCCLLGRHWSVAQVSGVGLVDSLHDAASVFESDLHSHAAFIPSISRREAQVGTSMLGQGFPQRQEEQDTYISGALRKSCSTASLARFPIDDLFVARDLASITSSWAVAVPRPSVRVVVSAINSEGGGRAKGFLDRVN